MVAELFFGLNIQQNDLAGLVYDHHGVRGRFQQPAVPAFHLGEILFRIDGRRARLGGPGTIWRPHSALPLFAMVSQVIGESLICRSVYGLRFSPGTLVLRGTYLESNPA